MQLSPHFTLAELTVSGWAKDNKVPNLPSNEQEWENIRYLAGKLENVRDLLGAPMLISSAFRAPRVNTAVGGSATSDHRFGLAADFIAPRHGDVTKICHTIADSGLLFDQLIWEYGRWVHIGFGSRTRRQLLTKRAGTGYVPGLPGR